MDLLNGEPVICLSGEEFLPKEGMTFIEQVSDFFSKQGGVANSPFGEVTLDKKGIKNDMAHGIGRLKACSFAAIKDVLENGVVINPMKQYHTNQKKNPTGMIAAPIMIGDEKYVCVVEVIANRQINRLYVHEVTLTKNLQGDVADSNAVHRDNNLVTHPQGEIAKVLQNYITANKSQENNSETNENKQYKTRYNMKKTIRLTESDLHRVIRESVKRVLRESSVPTYDTPVCLDCESKEDADYSVEIGFGSLSSSLYYVGDAYDASDALEKVMRYAKENGFAELYAGDEELADEYPDDYYYVLGYPIGIDQFVIHELN